MAWSPAVPQRESLGNILPRYGNSVSPIGSPRSDTDASDNDTDTDALVDVIQRAKAVEAAGIKSRKRSLSLSRTKHKRSLSSSERPDMLGLLPASYERNDDGSPRVAAAAAAAAPLLAGHKMASTGGIASAPMAEFKKSKKNKNGTATEAQAGTVVSSQDAQLSTLVAQTKAIQGQLTRMEANMTTLYTVSTKHLERIYNQVDELGRTGRIAHADDNLRLIADENGGTKSDGCCCIL